MQTNYQKSAARGGFSAQQVSRQNVQNILNKGRKEQEYIEAAAKSEEREAERQEKARKTQYEISASEEKRDYNIELTNIETQEKNRAAAAQINIEAQQKMFGSLSKLSANAASIYQKYEKEREEEQIKADYFEYQTNPKYREGVRQRAQSFTTQNAIATSDTNTSISASDAAGVNRTEIARISNATSPLTVGQQLGYVNETSRTYPAWVANKLASDEPILTINGKSYTGMEVSADPELFGQFSVNGLYEFMTETGLAGMSMEALSPALDNINQVNNRLQQQAANDFDRRARDERWTKWQNLAGNLLTFSSDLPENERQSFNNLMKSLLAGNAIIPYATNGQPSKGLDHIFNNILKGTENGRLAIPKDSALYKAIMEAPVGRNGEKVKDFEGRVKQLEAEQLQIERQADNRARVDRKNAAFDTVNAAMPDLLEQLEAAKEDPSEVKSIIDTFEKELMEEYGAYGVGNSTLTNLRSQYASGAIEAERNEIVEQARNGTLDKDQILENVDNEKNQEYALKLFEQQETNKYGTNYKTTLESIPGWAAEVSGGALVTGPDGSKVKNPYQDYIERDMKREFKKEFQSSLAKYLSEGKDSGTAQALAAKDARTWIDTQRFEAEANNPKARYYQLPSPGNSKVKSYPNLNITGPLTKPMKDVKSNVQLLKGKALSTYGAILTTAQMRDLSQRYNAMNGSYSVPPSVELVRQALVSAGEKYSAKDIINEQIKAYNAYQQSREPQNRLAPIDELITTASEENFNQNANEETIRIFNDARALTPVRARRATADPALRGNSILQASYRPGFIKYTDNPEVYRTAGNAFQGSDGEGPAGFRVREHIDFGGVAPGVHSANGFHPFNEAFDITHFTNADGSDPGRGESIRRTGVLKDYMRHIGAFKEVLGPASPNSGADRNHESHLHVGGLRRPLTPEEAATIQRIASGASY